MKDPEALRVVALVEAAAAPGADPDLADAASQAVHALFEAHHPRVLRVCQRILGDRERAADITQEVFITAWRQLAEWRGEGTFFSWLFSMAKFKCMNAVRKKRDLLADDGLLEGVDTASGPATGLRRHHRHVLLQRAADVALDDLEKEVLHLRYHEGLGQDEITRILSLPGKSGARGVLVRCRRKLQRELQRQAGEMNVGPSFFAVTR